MTPERPRPSVSVIVVTYNSSEVLEPLLSSLRQAAPQTAVDVTVVDNASADRSRSQSIADGFDARFLALEDNLGYGGGANAAFRALAAPGSYVLVCNADLEFAEGAIDRLVEVAEAAPHAGTFGPAIRNDDGTIYPSARRSPSLRVGVGHAVLANVAPHNKWSARYRGEEESSSIPREADWLSGACLLIRRELFAELGGFDEGYFMYFEDVDLGDRTRAHGYANLYVPVASVRHTGGHSTAQTSARMLEIHHRSAYRYLARRYPGFWRFPLRVVLRVGLRFRERLAVRRATAAPTVIAGIAGGSATDKLNPAQSSPDSNGDAPR